MPKAVVTVFFSGMPQPERPPCAVCSGRSDCTRFGVHSCRSCADFYKRTMLAGRTFVCRNADRQCTINHSDRHNCRGCRFEKCVALGMKLPPSIIVAQPIRRKEPLLSLIANEYSESIARRKVCESTLIPTALARHVKADYDKEELLLCTWPFIMDCMKLCSGDYIHFAASCFPEFAALSLEEQRIIHANCADRIYAVEKMWWTVKKFGTYQGPLYMGTLTTCFDSRKLQFFTEGLAPTVCIALMLSITVYTEQLNRSIGPILHRSCFTDVEFAKIIALCIWQIDPNQFVPDDLTRLSGAMRLRLFHALEAHYRDELELSNYSARIGNILLFEQALQNVRGCAGQRSLEYE